MTVSSTPDSLGAYSKQTQATPIGEFNRTAFLVRMMLNKTNIATLVKVMAVSNNGDNSPVGTVDVQVLVNQLDGQNNAVPHITIYGLPYFRLQGGTNAIILDPQKDDIGLAIFADRDISAVKTAKGQANPGSFRRNDFADGLYIGVFLGESPDQYIQFNDDGVTVKSPNLIKLSAPIIEIDGMLDVDGDTNIEGELVVTGDGHFGGTVYADDFSTGGGGF